MKQIFLNKWQFSILPLFYLILSFTFLGGIKHFYISDFDASYVYLLNGVNLASGHFRVGIVEHPGTPVEIFAGIVIFVRHLFSGNTILYQDVLLHPESYLFTCGAVLALLLSITTYFAGTYVYRHSGNIGLALLFQISPLFYSDIVKMTISLSAESSITICGFFFMAYLYVNTIECTQNQERKTTNRNIILFGLFTALLFTTKIYCAPILLMVFFMIEKERQRIIYLASFAVFTILLLFPLYNQLRTWAAFIKAAIFHSGAYGQGSSGIIKSTLYKSNLIEIFTTHYLFISVYIFVLVAFLVSIWGILRKRKGASNFIFPITSILIAFTIFILIIAKQYKVIYPEPLTHQVISITKFYYFIPFIVCFPLFISVSYKIIVPLISSSLFHLYKQRVFYGVLAIFIIWNGQKAFAACYAVRNQNVAFEQTSQFLEGWKKTPLIIVSDGDKSRVELALFLGISYSGKWDMPQYFDFVSKTYPNTYLYTTYDDALLFWGQKIDLPTILKKSDQALIYLSGKDSTIDKIILTRICDEKSQANKINYKKIYCSDNKYENIYLIKADTLR